MGHNHRIHRRQLLKNLAGLSALAWQRSPLLLLINAIVNGSKEKAIAQSLGLQPRKYVHILQQGAPPRWTFDLFLTPYSNGGFTANPQLGTTFIKNGSVVDTTYTTITKKGLLIPALWQFQVPAAGGGTRVMDPLLDNLLHLRGIEVKIPDHGAAQSLQFVPLGAAHSMTALSADHSLAPIAAINLSLSEYQFKSLFAKSAVTVPNGGNMLSSLLSPFVRSNSAGFEAKRTLAAAAIDAAVAALNQSATLSNSGAAVLGTAHKAASDLLSTGFGNITTTWNTLYNKYHDLVVRALSTTQSLPGINDQSLAPDGTSKFQLNGTILNNSDLRTLVTSTSNVSRLAEHFAVAEYVLLNNLSDSISIGPGSLNNLSANGATDSLGTDEHTTSGVISTLLNSYMNLAYAACLLEFIDQLKAKSLFNETVIVMGGEFGRSARTDGTGSDHGYMGSSCAIYCGAINGPMVLGNIYNNKGQNSSDSGTWGLGAPVAELGRPLSLSDWSSTIAFLLRVPSPVTSGTSVVLTNTSGQIVSAIEKARQV